MSTMRGKPLSCAKGPGCQCALCKRPLTPDGHPMNVIPEPPTTLSWAGPAEWNSRMREAAASQSRRGRLVPRTQWATDQQLRTLMDAVNKRRL